MPLAKLSIDLEARLAGLQQSFERAVRITEGSAKGMSASFAAVGGAIRTVVGLLGAGFGVSAFVGMVKSANDALLAIKDLSEATGASVENISALEDVARVTGGSLDTVGPVLLALNKALRDTGEEGSRAQDALRALGVDARDLQALDPAEALFRLAKAAAQYADDGNKARIIQEIFKGSTKDAATLLRDLAEETRLQGSVTAQAAEEADRFDKALARLRTGGEDLARVLTERLVPALSDTIERWSRLLGGGGAANNRSLQLRDQIAATVAEIERLTAAADELGGIDSPGAKSRFLPQQLEGYRTRYAALQRQAAAARGELDKIADVEDARRVSKTVGAVRPLGGTPSKKPKEAVPELFGPEIPAPLADALARIEAADETKLARLRQEMTALVAVAESGAHVPPDAFAALAEEITALDPAVRDAAAAMDALQLAMEEGRAVFQATRTPSEQLATEIDRLNRLLQVGAIDWDTYARATFAAQDRFDAANAAARKAAESTSDVARDLGLTFSSAFEDAIVGGNKLSDVLRGMEQDILRIVTRKLVTEPLGNFATAALKGLMSPGGGAGGGLSGLISSAGSWLSSIFGGFFADGGYLPPGRWGIAGERGPEPIFGGRTGLTVQPAGASTQIVNHFHLSGAADMRTQQQMAARAGESVQRALARNR